MNADDYMKQYLPDFDTEAERAKLQDFAREELVERLLMAYKNVQIMARLGDTYLDRLRRIEKIATESIRLPSVDQPPPNF